MKMLTGSHRIAKWTFILVNLIGYWGLSPWLLSIAATKIDRALKLSLLPAGAGLAIGSLFLAIGVIASLWIAVALYVRGGGFPIALLPPSRLVREGPYSLSRHPLYLSFTLYLSGWAMIARSIGFLAVVLPGFALIWSIYALVHEERVLLRRFGEEYHAYRKATPFFFRLGRARSGPGALFCITYLFAKPIIWLFFPIEVTGQEHLAKTGPAVIIANHACYLDPVFLTASSNRYIRFLTTAEMMRTPLGRRLFTRFGSIPIRRYASDPGAVRKLLSALKQGEIVGIFSEGERSWDGNPLPVSRAVKKLLAKLDVPIVPARIEGSYAIYPRWAKFPLPGAIKVRFFAPINPPFSLKDITSALKLIAVRSDGKTLLPRSPAGIERLLWACPSCHSIGTILTQRREIHCVNCHASWTIDRRLRIKGTDGKSIPLAELVAPLKEERIFQGHEALTSRGHVELLQGGKVLRCIASGKARYQDETFPRIGSLKRSASRVFSRGNRSSGVRLNRMSGLAPSVIPFNV
jgi:1-acyl-sn-glycerol-3-phosphate acyltransferase